MNSSQDQDGPSGQDRDPGAEQPNGASTPPKTPNQLSTNSHNEAKSPPSDPAPAATSAPATTDPPPTSAAPAEPSAAADATSTPISTAAPLATTMPTEKIIDPAPTSESVSKQTEEALNQQGPSEKAPEVDTAAGKIEEPSSQAPTKDAEVFPDGMQPQDILAGLAAEQFPVSLGDPAVLQNVLFDPSASQAGLANPYFVDTDPNAYGTDVQDPPPELILERMRTGFQPALPLSLSQTQLMDLSGWENAAFNGGWPAYDQQQEFDESDQEEDHGPSPDQGYGKLILPDTEHWITSRIVLIGRDVKLYKHIKAEHEYEQKLQQCLDQGLAPPDPPPRALRKYKSSYISQEGGALGPGSDDEEEARPAKRRKTAAARQSPSQQQGRAGTASNVISSRQYFERSRPVDMDSLRPSDEVVVRLNIHGAGPDYATMYQHTKGISREHLKIQYNRDKRIWEAIVLGRNGVFLRDHTQTEDFVHHKMDEVITLRSGDVFQIQKVEITFTLNGVENGKTGAELESKYSEGGKEMSFDFQSSRGDEMRDTDDSSVVNQEVDGSEKLAERALVDSDDSDDSDEEMADAPNLEKVASRDQDGGSVEEIRETVESDQLDDIMKLETSPGDADALAQLPLPPKKRGPGRPPKNGIMSKREERLLKKQAQEEAKKNMPPQEPGEQPQKRKVGRPRKHPLPEDAEGQSEKRKYKPRRSKGEDGEDEDGEKPAKEKSQKHKTPPLELKREDFTEEQLQKPTKNYQMLIDEIMTAAPPKGYSLKQVYKRIQERWPFFYFCVDTKGWESSVRHNLLGSECFKKIDGNWHRVPGVPLESGKKRKPSDATADPRAGGIYNGYSHPYHPPPHGQPHGHQPMAHSSGLSQPNLPPRYPPNGQAYQILQGPPPATAQPGVAPNHQGPPRPGFPQQQTMPPGAQANGFTTAGAPPRPHFQGTQPPPYNPLYGNRPPAQHAAPAAAPGPPAGQAATQRPPIARPGQVAAGMPMQGAQAGVNSPNVPRPAAAPAPQAATAISTPPAPLGPVIEPALKTFIRDFRAEVVKQLHAKEGKRSEAVAMSVINRGLGLTDRSLVPELEAYEKLILTVFHQHKTTYPKLRAEAAARAAAASSAARPPAQAPAPGAAGSAAAGPQRVVAPPTTSTTAISSQAPAASQAGPVGSSNAIAQTNKPVGTTTGPVPSGGTNVPVNPNVVKAAPPMPTSGTSRPLSNDAAPKTASTSNPVASGAVSATPPTSTPVTAAPTQPPASAARPSPSTSAHTVAHVPKPVATGSAPNTSANILSTSTNRASTTPNPVANAPAPKPATNAGASVSSTPSSVVPASAAPSAQKPAASGSATTVGAPMASASPRPAGSGSTPQATPVNVTATGAVSKSIMPTGAPTSSNPAPNGLRAASTTPATPATPDASKDAELLDPKLVSVILTFKKAILPTLAEKLDLILGESLIMSAVDRMLGFTDDTFVQVKTEQQQKNLAEAEKALMKHLETRFHEYLRTRSASR